MMTFDEMKALIVKTADEACEEYYGGMDPLGDVYRLSDSGGGLDVVIATLEEHGIKEDDLTEDQIDELEVALDEAILKFEDSHFSS